MADKTITAGLQIKASVDGEVEIKGLAAEVDKAAEKADKLDGSGKKLGDTFDGMPGKLNPFAAALGKTGDGLDKVGGKSASAAESLLSFGKGAAAALGVTAALDKVSDGLQRVLDTSTEYTAIKSRMEYAFGGVEAAGQQMEWVKGVAAELGLEVKSVANGYAQLASATKNINISTEQTQQVFEGVAAAAASMNLSTEETNGVLLALSQIAGKGKVSMEELRGQLGERLTPAMAIAAKSMGVTTAELEKMVESGIAAEEFLPKFGAAMAEAFSGAESASAPLNRLKNQLDELMLKIADSGLNDAYNQLLTEVGDALTWIEEKVSGLDGALTGAFGDSLTGAWDTLKTGLSELGDMVATAYDGINSIGSALDSLSGGSGNFDLIKNTLDGLNVALGVISDGFKGLSIAFDVSVGAIQSVIGDILLGLSKLTFGEVSANFAQAAADIEAKAAQHFDAAQEKALAFESSAVAAFKRAQESEAERYARLETEAREAYAAASQAAVEAAAKAKQAQEAALQAVGTSQEEAAKKAAEAADKQAASALKAAQSSGTAWEEAAAKAGVGAESAAQIKQPLAELEAAAKQSAAAVADVGNSAQAAQSKVAEAFAKIGVDAEAVTNGVSSKAKQAFADFQTASQLAAQSGETDARLISAAFEQMMGKLESAKEFEAFRAQLEESGNAAYLTQEQLGRLNEAAKSGAGAAKTAYQALADSIKSAAAADLSNIGEQAKAAMESGSISAAQYDQVIAQVNTRTRELQSASADMGIQAEESHHRAAAAAQSHAAAEREAASASKEAADATQQVSKSVADYGYRMSQTHGYVKLTTEELEKLKKEMGGTYFGAAAERNAVAWKEQVEIIANAREAMDGFNQAVSDGTADMALLEKASWAVNAAADTLDSADLANFRSAIESARKSIQALSDEAQDTLAEINAELAEINGDSEATYALQQTKKLAELQEKMQEAQKAGNSEAVGYYAQAIAAQKKLYQAQKEQRESAAQSSSAPSSGSGEAKSTLNLAQLFGNAATPQVNIDADGLAEVLAQRDQAVADKVTSQLLNQLNNAVKRSV
ncbi:tape measure domain-containing protein [Neisseria perflava]|uniref:tape measure protein n=1 Tax=Neisseria perflava TaxID=33053 RepID=UPI0020A18371|nr:tape measure protein [Neisseria perflava]MCP1772850.1 tape measure domain-containing protein [Neisseria perflava]